jgi:hypothetical protein
MKGLNIIILVAFIAFVIAIVGLTLDFFHVFDEPVFILAILKFQNIMMLNDPIL